MSPADLEDWDKYEGAKVSATVESQIKNLPLLKGIRVLPSALMAFSRCRPVGSSAEGNPANLRSLQISSLSLSCLQNLPLLLLQDKPWDPELFTFSP